MTTRKGVWNLQQVRDKQLQVCGLYTNAGGMYLWGTNNGHHGVIGTK
jgi:hypothetical protein